MQKTKTEEQKQRIIFESDVNFKQALEFIKEKCQKVGPFGEFKFIIKDPSGHSKTFKGFLGNSNVVDVDEQAESQVNQEEEDVVVFETDNFFYEKPDLQKMMQQFRFEIKKKLRQVMVLLFERLTQLELLSEYAKKIMQFLRCKSALSKLPNCYLICNFFRIQNKCFKSWEVLQKLIKGKERQEIISDTTEG